MDYYIFYLSVLVVCYGWNNRYTFDFFNAPNPYIYEKLINREKTRHLCLILACPYMSSKSLANPAKSLG
jgi:hypothetical protein